MRSRAPMPYSTDTHGMVLIAAVRYALGRRTYAVRMVTTAVLASHRAGMLDENDRGTILRDIREAAKRSDLGDSCDRSDWLDLLAFLDPSTRPQEVPDAD